MLRALRHLCTSISKALGTLGLKKRYLPGPFFKVGLLYEGNWIAYWVILNKSMYLFKKVYDFWWPFHHIIYKSTLKPHWSYPQTWSSVPGRQMRGNGWGNRFFWPTPWFTFHLSSNREFVPWIPEKLKICNNYMKKKLFTCKIYESRYMKKISCSRHRQIWVTCNLETQPRNCFCCFYFYQILCRYLRNQPIRAVISLTLQVQLNLKCSV